MKRRVKAWLCKGGHAAYRRLSDAKACAMAFADEIRPCVIEYDDGKKRKKVKK